MSGNPRRLVAVLAHPDDESLGFGGTLAKYADEGVEVSLVTATSGEAGRYRGHPQGDPRHPGARTLKRIREGELRAAAAVLGIRDVTMLGYPDGALDETDPLAIVAQLAEHVRRLRPDVVLTFGPDGAYGHPDHIAISQFATAAVVTAAGSRSTHAAAASHRVSKLYYLAWPEPTWHAYEAVFGRLTSSVDGVTRRPAPWPEWAITTTIDTRSVWSVTRRAIACHESQVAASDVLARASDEDALWTRQSFYRVFSTVNGGHAREADLFEGIGDCGVRARTARLAG
jgi:LmbE family N-acetylglucosaminyl deacetylase